MRCSLVSFLKASTRRVLAVPTLQALPQYISLVGCWGEQESTLSRLTGWCQILFTSEPVNKLNSITYQQQRVTRNRSDTSIIPVLSWDPAPRTVPFCLWENCNFCMVIAARNPKKNNSFPWWLFKKNKSSTNFYVLDSEQHSPDKTRRLSRALYIRSK